MRFLKPLEWKDAEGDVAVLSADPGFFEDEPGVVAVWYMPKMADAAVFITEDNAQDIIRWLEGRLYGV